MSGGAERTAYESDSLGRHPVSTVALTFPNGPDSSLDAYRRRRRRRRYFSVSIPFFRFNVAAHSPKVVSVPLHSGHKHTTVQWSSLFSLSAALIYIQIAIPNHFFSLLVVAVLLRCNFPPSEENEWRRFLRSEYFFLLLYCLFSELLLSFSFCVYFSPLAQGLMGRRRSTMAGSF